jgi:alpha-beta hydrolase superfamily lysophospholipase
VFSSVCPALISVRLRLDCPSCRVGKVDRPGATDSDKCADTAVRGPGGGNAESHIIRASDGAELHYLRWATRGEPWAAVIFIHGIASHAAWFGETADALREQGVVVYAADRRGSGMSGGLRGHLARYSRALEDLDEVMRVVAADGQGTPLFLAASSWAAKLAVLYSAMRPGELRGLLLLGPGLLPRVNLSLMRRVTVVAGHRVAPTARLEIPLTPELYTSTPRFVEFIRADPLRLITATLQFFWETARLDRHRRRASANLRLPLLVLQGENDAMMDVPKTRRWFAQLGTADKTYRSYPGAGHTLDFEPDPSQYVADMLAWLRARVPLRDSTGSS